jgi:hypothetical protein
MPPNASYDPDNHSIHWQGSLAGGESRRFVYGLTGSLVSDRPQNLIAITHAPADLGQPRLSFKLPASYPLDSAAGSTIVLFPLSPTPEDQIEIGATVYPTESSMPFTATLHIPPPLEMLTVTIQTSPGSVTIGKQAISWHGNLLNGAPLTITLSLSPTLSSQPIIRPLLLEVTSEDGVSEIAPYWLEVNPYRQWMPMMGIYSPVNRR